MYVFKMGRFSERSRVRSGDDLMFETFSTALSPEPQLDDIAKACDMRSPCSASPNQCPALVGGEQILGSAGALE